LLGKIKGENCYGENKLARLTEYVGDQRHQLHLIGYTDHHSDVPFLEWVDQAVAINPTHKLHKIALQQDFAIEDWNKN
jgi:phosphoserine phosphatase